MAQTRQMGDDDRVTDEQPETMTTTETTTTPDAPATIEAPSASIPAPTRKRAGLPAREGRPRRGRDPLDPSLFDPDAVPEVDPEALALAHRIVDLAVDKKASEIVLIDIHTLTSIADYLIICSGGSERQLGAIADGISEKLRSEGVRPIGREGGSNSHWTLVDFGAVIVHIFAPPEREYYQLERHWSLAKTILRVQ